MTLLDFGRRLKAAWALLALVALVQGGVALWAIGEAAQQVERGRVASDLLSGFSELAAAPAVDPARLAALEVLRERALQLEPGARALHAARGASLQGLRSARPSGPLLAEALTRERAALATKRAAADRSLARVRALALGATAALALLAALLALGFARALRHPMADAAERAQQLDHALQRLTEQTARRRQWLADISHELRTPTTAIRGEAEIALRGADKPATDYRDSLTRIADGARHLGGVIDDLLLLARAESEGLSLQREPLDGAALLQQVLAQMAPVAAQRGVQLQADPLPPMSLRADAQRLRQILLLLLDNALAYTPAGGTVRLHVEPGWRLRIVDSGIGLSAAELATVFERGTRGDAARRLRADGSGLGLPLARALAEAHGARLSLHSPGVGQGCEALLEWPADA